MTSRIEDQRTRGGFSMKVVKNVTDMIIRSAKLHQIISIFFAVFGLINLLIGIYQLFFNQSIHGWYREIYGNLVCSSSYQVYMGIVAALTFSKLRKDKDIAG
jgi:hypothetical protein